MGVLVKPDIYAAIENGEVCIGLPDSTKPEGWNWWTKPEDLHIGPNSIDLHLHPKLKVYGTVVRDPVSGELPPIQDMEPLDARKDNPTRSVTIPEDGMVLWPGVLYLARTVERTKLNAHIPELGGRSSTARLGVFVHATAGKGDVGFDGTWTLEISVIHPVCIYPLMRIAQLWLHEPSSQLPVADQYGGRHGGRYQGQVEATAYRGHHDTPAVLPSDEG